MEGSRERDGIKSELVNPAIRRQLGEKASPKSRLAKADMNGVVTTTAHRIRGQRLVISFGMMLVRQAECPIAN